jgi:hypothetical protein
MAATSRTADTWRWSGTLAAHSWKSLVSSLAAVVARRRASRCRVRVAPLGADWLRRHEIESSKRGDPY